MAADEAYKKIDIETGILLNEIMNLEYHLPENEEVFDMCYAIEMIKQEAVDEAVKAEKKASKKAVDDAVKAERETAKKAERNAVILSTIETYRECNIAETDIKNKIMQRFILSADDAKEYMHAKSV